MNVLSLFDGMSCGQIALNKIGIKIDNYYASEIKPLAIKITQENYPNTIQLGDVKKIDCEKLPKIDLLIGGSPCQNLSRAMITQHRKGLDGNKSILFYEYYRIFKETNPTYFLLENVGSMDKEDEDIITEKLGVKPILINSELLSAQLRHRYYWTNIPGVVQPKDKKIYFNNILEYGWSERKKARCLLESDSRPSVTPRKMFHRHIKGFNTLIFKDENHYNECISHYKQNFNKMSAEQINEKILKDNIDVSVYNGVRYMNQSELEKIQTVPNGYTSSLTRDQAAGLLGDGWTVDVIAHIFSFLKANK